MTTLNENVHHLLDRQLAAWETARRSYDALAGVAPDPRPFHETNPRGGHTP
ncbi:hypothetical protein [Bacteroides togonis]|uniref:hypothetical protein n=1 Tax=Bacteroides togonis TaxID=1917883 RepID=UPI0013566159|nr:hypothetical protein [Bacteroides togonis]